MNDWTALVWASSVAKREFDFCRAGSPSRSSKVLSPCIGNEAALSHFLWQRGAI